MPNTIKVRFDRHFKVYVPVGEVASFEKELNAKSLNFYADKRTALLSDDTVLYYLLEKDSDAIHQLISESQTFHLNDVVAAEGFSEERKMIHLYLRFALLFIILTMVLKMVGAFVQP
ncbi:hypothetical protein [Flavobacterium sp.]|uniref:hypothetical protein n=1 Tax=Flavobacterium sp. TaxID=239 RepID=UPI0028BD76FC|nr:hypothetical protein [Flavobacterium sp.]